MSPNTPCLEFTVHQPGRAPEVLLIDAEHALVGSAAHCELRLPAADAAPEQLYVTSHAGGLRAEARSLEPPVTCNGSVFVQGRLLPGARLRCGRVELDVVQRQAAPARPERTRPPLRTWLAACAIGLALPGAVALALAASRSGAPALAAGELRSLWTGLETYGCHETEPGAAHARALHELAQARALEARAPFDVSAGLAAVEAFRAAVACDGVAGDSDAARANGTRAATLAAKLETQFRGHQLALARALATRRYAAAQRELSALVPYVAGRDGAYAEWLGAAQRHIEALSAPTSAGGTP